MNINKLHNTPHSISGPKTRVPEDHSAADSVTSAAVEWQGQYVDSGLNSIRHLQEQLPESAVLRQDLVNVAKARLNRGEYLTRDAASRAATSILNEI